MVFLIEKSSFCQKKNEFFENFDSLLKSEKCEKSIEFFTKTIFSTQLSMVISINFHRFLSKFTKFQNSSKLQMGNLIKIFKKSESSVSNSSDKEGI